MVYCMPMSESPCPLGHEGCASTHKRGRPRKVQEEALAPAPPAPEPNPTLGRLTRFVRDDGRSFEPDLWEPILEGYFTNRGNLTKVAKELEIPLGVLRRWKRENKDFSDALDTVRDIINDQIVAQLTDRALDPTERNPAWKIFFMKKNIAQYADRPKENQKIELTISDSTFKK